MPLVKEGWLVRPFLEVWRAEVEAYCKRHRLGYVQDSSNLNERFARNWVRLRLLPLLQERFGTKVKENIVRAAGLASALSEALGAWQEQWLAQMCERKEGRICLRLERLTGMPPALRLAVLHACLRRLAGEARDVGMVHLRALDRLCAEPAGSKQLRLPHNVSARREYGILSLEKVSSEEVGAGSDWGPVPVAIPGQTMIPHSGLRLVAREVSAKEACEAVRGQGATQVALDPRKVRSPLWVRCWQAGDRLEPRGMRGSKKLQDLFVDSRVPARRRRRVPIVVDDAGRIVWVVGLRVARGVAAAPGSRQAIHLASRPVRTQRGVSG